MAAFAKLRRDPLEDGRAASSMSAVMESDSEHARGSRFLVVVRWAALTAVLVVGVTAAISEHIFSQDLSPTAGLIVTAAAAVAGAVVSALTLLRSH